MQGLFQKYPDCPAYFVDEKLLYIFLKFKTTLLGVPDLVKPS